MSFLDDLASISPFSGLALAKKMASSENGGGLTPFSGLAIAKQLFGSGGQPEGPRMPGALTPLPQPEQFEGNPHGFVTAVQAWLQQQSAALEQGHGQPDAPIVSRRPMGIAQATMRGTGR